LPFKNDSDYDDTASFIEPAKIGGGAEFRQIAPLNASGHWKDVDRRSEFFYESIYQEIKNAGNASLQRLVATNSLPRRKQPFSDIIQSRTGDNNLNRLLNLLPDRISNRLAGPAKEVTTAFASAVAVSANLNMGGFDTDGNHHKSHIKSLNPIIYKAGLLLWLALILAGPHFAMMAMAKTIAA